MLRFFFGIDKFAGLGYNRGKESDFMSTREMLKRDIDIMPDYIVQMIGLFWDTMRKHDEERDEASFLQAIEDSRNGKLYGPFKTGAEAIASMLED
jgi:hypothetical protein